jgi:hypothetical protein
MRDVHNTRNHEENTEYTADVTGLTDEPIALSRVSVVAVELFLRTIFSRIQNGFGSDVVRNRSKAIQLEKKRISQIFNAMCYIGLKVNVVASYCCYFYL